MAPVLSLVVIGATGLVGSEFVRQIAGDARVVVEAVCTSTRAAVRTEAEAETETDPSAEALLKQMAPHADALSFAVAGGGGRAARKRRACVLVDCTAAAQVAECYPRWLAAGLHIATPNKKPFAGPAALYADIRAAAARARALVYHEASVGAGLPVIATLADLVDTGDRIVRIEGVFSGTLSYIFNNFSSTDPNAPPVKFSDVVLEAKEKGFTEPDPRDDLNGMDVGRKVVILGRVAGLSVSLESIPIENIVPEPLRALSSASDFLAKLPDFDAYFASLNASARANGRVLRCVGVVDPVNGCSVRLAEYEASHPFASLKGSDNIIAFTTRNFPSPLIIQGAGAGAAVTAFGIYSDVLKIARQVGFGAAL